MIARTPLENFHLKWLLMISFCDKLELVDPVGLYILAVPGHPLHDRWWVEAEVFLLQPLSIVVPHDMAHYKQYGDDC